MDDDSIGALLGAVGYATVGSPGGGDVLRAAAGKARGALGGGVHHVNLGRPAFVADIGDAISVWRPAGAGLCAARGISQSRGLAGGGVDDIEFGVSGARQDGGDKPAVGRDGAAGVEAGEVCQGISLAG